MGLARVAGPAGVVGLGQVRVCVRRRARALWASGVVGWRSRWISRISSTVSTASPATLGGLSDVWRFDRMATVCHPATGRVTASFAAVAKHYGVSVAICPPRHGNRKGVVEKANDVAAQRWWRTLPDDVTVEEAQASLDRFCAERADARMRVIGETREQCRGARRA